MTRLFSDARPESGVGQAGRESMHRRTAHLDAHPRKLSINPQQREARVLRRFNDGRADRGGVGFPTGRHGEQENTSGRYEFGLEAVSLLLEYEALDAVSMKELWDVFLVLPSLVFNG